MYKIYPNKYWDSPGPNDQRKFIILISTLSPHNHFSKVISIKHPNKCMWKIFKAIVKCLFWLDFSFLYQRGHLVQTLIPLSSMKPSDKKNRTIKNAVIFFNQKKTEQYHTLLAPALWVTQNYFSQINTYNCYPFLWEKSLTSKRRILPFLAEKLPWQAEEQGTMLVMCHYIQ